MIHQAIFSGHWKTYKISVRVIKILSPNFVYKGKEVIAGNYSIAVPTSKVLTACSRSWWGRERWGRGEMGCLNNSRSVCWDLEPFPNTRSKHTNVLRPNFRIRTCGIGPHSMKVFSQSKNKINAGPPPPPSSPKCWPLFEWACNTNTMQKEETTTTTACIWMSSIYCWKVIHFSQ